MRNILIKGSPGTGKTYFARAAAYYICGQSKTVDEVFSQNIAADKEAIENFVHGPRCEYVQVHASMGYEDIVYGSQLLADGTLGISYAEKRIKQICDRARNDTELYCVIFDDITRANAGSLLGNLLYAIEYRNCEVSLSEGLSLIVPDNLLFIFTECVSTQNDRLDFALRRRMDYIKELWPSADALRDYYYPFLGESGTTLVLNVYQAFCNYVDRVIAPEYRGHEKEYYPGHGMFMIKRGGTPAFIIDSLRSRILYQVFPYIAELHAAGILQGNYSDFSETINAMVNSGFQHLDRVLSIEKILVTTKEMIPTFSLEDTREYYRTVIIPDLCSDYRTMLECLIDAVILNGVFSYDYLLSSLLLNTEAAAVPSKIEEGVFASYLALENNAEDYYYETARKNRPRVAHAYYGLTTGKANRWGDNQSVAYRVIYNDGTPSQTYIPLNGVRLHTFTTNNVCKSNNPAEIYGAMYRLIDFYLATYAQNLDLIKGNDPEYCDLHNLVRLEIKYLEEIHRQLRNISLPNPTDKEKARIQYFGSKVIEFRTLWNHRNDSVSVDPVIFEALVNGSMAFTVESFEDMFSCAAGSRDIQIKGVVKMADLHDYQRIMENIGVRQMIFQGPPGTSKTFESKKFVLKHLNPNAAIWDQPTITQEDISHQLEQYKLSEADYSDPTHSTKLATGGWDLVQFHPSYGYEDFIRGIEVRTTQGMPSYHTVNRILGKISEFAKVAEAANPTTPPKFYLVIDEINRANLATVFGELIYGLEYRDSKVSTPYEVSDATSGQRTKDIVLGKNLFIIGTMNTADKSIDSIDYAIRRRFIFIDSPANRNVVLQCYRSISGNADEASIELMLFDAVQSVFEDERFFNTDYQKNDVKIGHTYFLRKKAVGYQEDAIEHFVFQVIPVLKEYVKDGILDCVEDLISMEHSADEIFAAADVTERNQMLAENVMLFAKEYGNVSRSGAIIDNAYIGRFIEDLVAKFAF